MNALKHMEAVFVIALAVAGIGSWAAATSQEASAAEQTAVQVAPQMAVVTVVGKRMTAAEKAASLREEARSNANVIASR
jgi:hypothetical protein